MAYGFLKGLVSDVVLTKYMTNLAKDTDEIIWFAILSVRDILGSSHPTYSELIISAAPKALDLAQQQASQGMDKAVAIEVLQNIIESADSPEEAQRIHRKYTQADFFEAKARSFSRRLRN